MYQDLSRRINLENIASLRAQNQRNRYQQSQGDRNQPIQDDDADDDFLDDLHIEIAERHLNFQRINREIAQDESDNENGFLRRNDRTPDRNQIRKLKQELELSDEKLKIIEINHRRELSHQEEIHKRREQLQAAQISKLKAIVAKSKIDSEQIKMLKSERNDLRELKDLMDRRLEDYERENNELKCTLKIYKGSQESERMKEISGCFEKEKQESILKDERVKSLENEIMEYKRICRQKEKKNEQYFQEIKKVKDCMEEKQRELERKQKQLERREMLMGEELASLRKRNQTLEETFIEKMSEITRLQANIITNNTSLNMHRMNSQQDQTINLHEQSPIRHTVAVHNNLSERKNRKKDRNIEDQNPEFNQQRKERQGNNICECCVGKTDRLEKKLKEANLKLLELLEEKAKTAHGNRTRIMSWANRAT